MELVVVLVALYLIECCVWVVQGQVALSPLAAAYVLCPSEIFGRLARWCYFCGGDASIGVRQDVDEFLAAVGRREDVLRPPDREDASSLSYSPRCQAQYTRSDGHCADCESGQVQPFI